MYIYGYVCMYLCVYMFIRIYVLCIHVLIYVCLLVISRCVYVSMCVFSVCVCLCLFVRLLVSIYVSQHKCLWKVNEISVCIFYLGCYLSVWHCYLGSIVVFDISIQNLYNLWTKPLNQWRLIYEQFIDVFIYFFCHE